MGVTNLNAPLLVSQEQSRHPPRGSYMGVGLVVVGSAVCGVP